MSLAAIPGLEIWGVRRALAQGRDHDAVAIAERYARRGKSSGPRWEFLFRVLLQVGATEDERESALRRGLVADPSSAELAYLLCGEMAHRGQYESASALLDLFERENGNSILIQLGRALLMNLTGDWKEVRVAVDKAVSMIDASTSQNIVAQVQAILSGVPGRSAKSLELLETLVKQKSRDPAPYIQLALRIEDKEPGRAAGLLRRARSIWGRLPGFDENLSQFRTAFERDRQFFKDIEAHDSEANGSPPNFV